LAEDNQTVVKERISLDKANSDIMHNVITIIDQRLPASLDGGTSAIAATARCVVRGQLQREQSYIVIGKENYYISSEGNGFLMPARKISRRRTCRYFKH